MKNFIKVLFLSLISSLSAISLAFADVVWAPEPTGSSGAWLIIAIPVAILVAIIGLITLLIVLIKKIKGK